MDIIRRNANTVMKKLACNIPDTAKARRSSRIFMIAFYALLVLDAAATIVVVRAGLAYEMNPIMKPLADSWLLVLVKLMAIPLVYCLLRKCPYKDTFYRVGTVCMGAVVALALSAPLLEWIFTVLWKY